MERGEEEDREEKGAGKKQEKGRGVRKTNKSSMEDEEEGIQRKEEREEKRRKSRRKGKQGEKSLGVSIAVKRLIDHNYYKGKNLIETCFYNSEV